MNPIVSIITPSFNQGRYLERCLRSVADQDYPNIEHIVFDGGSKDESVDVLKRFNGRIYWKSERDKNQCDAINKGLRLAKGDIVTWINSDDWLARGAVRTVVDFFQSHPEADFVYGNILLADPEDRTIEHMRVLPYRRNWLLYTKLLIPQPGCFVRRQVVEDCGMLDLSLPYVMDYEWWLRFIGRNRRPMFLDRYLAYFRLHDESKGCRPDLVKTIMREKRGVLEKYEPRARNAFYYARNSALARVGKRLARWTRDLLHPETPALYCTPRPVLLMNSITPAMVEFLNKLDRKLDWEPRLWVMQAPKELGLKLRMLYRVVNAGELPRALSADRPDAVIVSSDFTALSQASRYCASTHSPLLSWGLSKPLTGKISSHISSDASAEDFHRAVLGALANSRA